MPLEKHPLKGHRSWIFSQPAMTFSAQYLRRDLATGEEKFQNLECDFACREGLLNNTRQSLRTYLTDASEGDNPWTKRHRIAAEIVFDDGRGLVPGKANIQIRIPEAAFNATQEAYAAKLYLVANIVVGLPLLLLNPNRKPGEWSKLPPRFKPIVEGKARYFGVDISVLRHPALLSVATGLYRQADSLVRCGFAEQVLDSVPQEEVERALNQADWKKAFGLVDQARPWIQVPHGTGGSFQNYPFPWMEGAVGATNYWQRFIRLHRALRRHGFSKVLEDFSKGWNLEGQSQDYSGAFSFWGEGNLSEAHKRVMLLGKPLKRIRKKEAAGV